MSHHNRMQFVVVPAVAAAIWLQLLLMALCCCSSFITAQQMNIANPYKYQQLQYQKLQHQQQQYEYQKQIQQLYLQQQIKLQQQKQQQQQLQQQLLAEQEEKAAMQKLLEQQEQEKLLQQQQQLQEKLLQQQMQKELLQKQQQQEQELLRQQQIIQQQQHITYSLPMQTPQSPLQHYEQQLQQSQQQQHAAYPVSVSLMQQQQQQQLSQQQQHFSSQSSALPTQSQMLQTSASLIVDDECDEEEDSSEIVQKESTEYRINITPETIIQAAQPPTRRHPEAISLTDTQQQTDSDYNVASSIAPSTETFDFWRGFVEDEVTAPVAPTAIAETVPTAAAATAIAATAKATAPTSTATAEVARPIAKKRTTTTATAPTATAALTSSVSTAYDTTAPAFTSSAAALTATATAAASLAAVIPRSTAAATGTARQRKDTRPKTGKRRRKPAAVREPLAALEKEQKLYELRDRQRQEFVAEVTSAYRDKSYRRPYSQSKKPDESQESSSSGNSTISAKKSVELKNILKKSGGMSLSEILQQKNLSLDDLLKGKQTALLALQTTSATVTQQNPTPVRKLKPQRRVVPTAHTGTSSATLSASAETFSGSGESESNEQKPFGKNKLKFPALQRLKLFGTSSRGGEVAGSKRREATNSTMARSTSTTTTTTSTTTKRVPIYRKRQQLLQRTTLKPLGGLLKASTSTAETVTQAPTPVAALKILPPTAMETREIVEEEEEIDQTTEVEEETLPTTTASSTTSSTTTPIPPAKSTSTISSRRSSTSTTTMATNPQTRAANVINRTQTNAVPSNTKSRTQTKYALDITNPQTNSIEHEDDTLPPSGKSAESLETAVTYADDDLEDFFEEATTKRNANNNSTTSSSTTTFPNSLVERLTPRSDRYPVKPTGDYDNLPYVDPVDDRTDLLELIEDRRSGNRLFKVLEQRNMTLEELIEHRKRGSSQLHLAMVVQNRSRFFPDKKVILRDNMDIVTAFENFPHFNLMNLKSVKPDEIKTDSQGSSYFTSIIDIEPTDEIYRDEKKGAVSSAEKSSSSESDSVNGPTYAQLQRTEKSLGFLPPWKTLALASSSVRTANNKQNSAFYLPQPKLLLDTEIENNDSQEEFVSEDADANLSAEQIPARHSGAIDTAEAIENEVARAHDLLDLELSGHGFKRSPTAAAASMANQKPNSIYGNMPAGIRSAIVASAAIVLTSLATFMVIFVVCRWKQHRKRKTNYMKTYNAMKSKLPMIATTTTSRQSTLHRHHHHIEDSSMVVQSTGIQQQSQLPPQQQHQQQQLQQPNARLFRSSSSHSLGGGGLGVTLCSSRLSSSGSGRLGSGGIGTATGSTTSLALSLRSAHNISNTKLNTMDPNSPEVQEYLFDALRKSF